VNSHSENQMMIPMPRKILSFSVLHFWSLCVGGSWSSSARR